MPEPKSSIPGLEVVEEPTPFDIEMEDIRSDINRKIVENEIEAANYSKTLLDRTIAKIRRGDSVEITDEMRELGLDKAIKAAAWEQYFLNKINLCGGDD